MSFVTIQPVVLAAATGDLPTIGTAVSARNTAVCAPTTGVLPPAANDVSVLTAARFTAHTKHYRVVSKPAALVHGMFVALPAATADVYATTEAVNVVATG
ncbi:PE family protein [Mycobacterium tuberculosis]|uniref:PE family protein n=1 Tax=Mycobacterium tuberculosis TaxID=1773 RepID=UPI0032B6097C